MAGNRVRYSVMLLLLSQGLAPCIIKNKKKWKHEEGIMGTAKVVFLVNNNRYK